MTATPAPRSGALGADLGLHLLAKHDDGSVEVVLDAQPRHEREGGIVHGAMLMALLDSAMTGAVDAAVPAEDFIASATITTDFMKPAKQGRLVARGWLDRRGRSMAFARGEVRDADGNVVARGNGIWAIQARRA